MCIGGIEVKNQIKHLGFTLKEVADEMKIPLANLYSLLKTRDMKLSTLAKIAEATRQSIEFFQQDNENNHRETELLIGNMKSTISNLQERLLSLEEKNERLIKEVAVYEFKCRT